MKFLSLKTAFEKRSLKKKLINNISNFVLMQCFTDRLITTSFLRNELILKSLNHPKVNLIRPAESILWKQFNIPVTSDPPSIAITKNKSLYKTSQPIIVDLTENNSIDESFDKLFQLMSNK